MVIPGMPEKATPVSAFSRVVGRRTLAGSPMGSPMGSIEETQRMLDFCGEHGIVAEIQTIAMKDLDEAFVRIDPGDMRFRFVVDMATLRAELEGPPS